MQDSWRGAAGETNRMYTEWIAANDDVGRDRCPWRDFSQR
jgi:hypothetical protein